MSSSDRISLQLSLYSCSHPFILYGILLVVLTFDPWHYNLRQVKTAEPQYAIIGTSSVVTALRSAIEWTGMDFHHKKEKEMQHAFASRRFAAAVRTRRGEQSLREAASEIATVSPATLLRFEQAMVRPEVPTFLRICDWLHLSPQIFLHGDDDGGLHVLEAIEHDLRADDVLAPRVIDALLVLICTVRSTGVLINKGNFGNKMPGGFLPDKPDKMNRTGNSDKG